MLSCYTLVYVCKKQYRHIFLYYLKADICFFSIYYIFRTHGNKKKQQQHVMYWRVPTFFAVFSFKTRRTHTSISLHGKSRLTDSAIIAVDFFTGTLNKKVFLVDLVVIIEKIRAQIKLATRKWSSLRKHPFLLALRGWRRFARRNASATQRQKFHTDDANQCLLNKFVSHGVPSVNLFNFRFLLVDFGKMLCSTANEPQQNSNHCPRQDYIPQILTVLL